MGIRLELNQLEETHTEGTHRCFIDCFDLNGEHLWQIDVIVDGQFDSTFLSPSNLDQILFYGRLTGNIEAGSFSFNCENPQWVGLLISSSGEVNTISPISSKFTGRCLRFFRRYLEIFYAWR